MDLSAPLSVQGCW